MALTEVKILREEIRQVLLRNGGETVRSTGVYQNKYYRNEYKLSDFDIYHEFEAPDLTDASNTFSLTKPLLILYVEEETDESGTVDHGALNIEFQMAVNFAPSGFITLLGYLELLRVIVNPRDKRMWLSAGLAIRHRQVGPIINGVEIKETLKDRILVQSIIGQFTNIGAE
jgi:hypothetical protein